MTNAYDFAAMEMPLPDNASLPRDFFRDLSYVELPDVSMTDNSAHRGEHAGSLACILACNHHQLLAYSRFLAPLSQVAGQQLALLPASGVLPSGARGRDAPGHPAGAPLVSQACLVSDEHAFVLQPACYRLLATHCNVAHRDQLH